MLSLHNCLRYDIAISLISPRYFGTLNFFKSAFPIKYQPHRGRFFIKFTGPNEINLKFINTTL